MKKLLLSLSACALLGLSLWAQKPAAPKTVPKKAVPAPVGTTYLGASSLTGGSLSKRTFDSLIRQGIRTQDPTGATLPVAGFQLTYAERGVYEDSVGNPILTVDYLSEYCFGDTLSANIRAVLPDRTKAGDTVFVDNVKVRAKGGTDGFSRPMRFVLTR